MNKKILIHLKQLKIKPVV